MNWEDNLNSLYFSLIASQTMIRAIISVWFFDSIMYIISLSTITQYLCYFYFLIHCLFFLSHPSFLPPSFLTFFYHYFFLYPTYVLPLSFSLSILFKRSYSKLFCSRLWHQNFIFLESLSSKWVTINSYLQDQLIALDKSQYICQVDKIQLTSLSTCPAGFRERERIIMWTELTGF